jgi:hypothetical protein
MPKFNDLTGQTIGRLTFLSHEYISPKRFWTVRCQCGELERYRADYFLRMKNEGLTFECYKCKLERNNPTLTGKVFGRLTVLGEVPGKDHHRWYLCRCECGVEKEIAGVNLSGRKNRTPTRSCGCLCRKLHSKWANTTQYPPSHALRSKNTNLLRASLYHCRNAMLSSCYNKHDRRYKNHGALGHGTCDLWRNGASDFVKWAIENNYIKGFGVYLKKGETIFSPENCYVELKSSATKIRNSKFIEYNGKTQSITDWANELKCSISCLACRIKRYEKYGLDKIMDLSWSPKRQIYRK